MEIILSILCLTAAGLVNGRAVDKDSYQFEETKHHRHHRRKRFTIEELTNTRFPHAITGDLDIDVCKAGGFLGDIALPNIKYETEWRQQKLNKSYLEELEKYREEVLKEGLQVEEEGLTEILQFKNEHDANNEAHREEGESLLSRGKSEPIMVDRNQYNMGAEFEDEFSFNVRNEDTNPEIKEEGIEIRLESTTLPAKKRHSAHRQNYLTISESSNIGEGRIEQTTSRQPDDVDFSIGSTTVKSGNGQEGNSATGGYLSTIRPETTTQERSKQRHRRHHRRRYVYRM